MKYAFIYLRWLGLIALFLISGCGNQTASAPTAQFPGNKNPMADIVYTDEFPAGDSNHRISWPSDEKNVDGNVYWHYLIHIPDSPPTGLVVFLHSQMNNGISFCKATNARQFSQEKGLVVVCPTAYTFGWREPLNVDMGFVNAVLDQVKQNVAIPEGKTFVVGFSGGGELTFKMACELTDSIDGIAVWAAAWPPGKNSNGQLFGWAKDCHPEKPLSIWNGVGGQDNIFPDQTANIQGWRSFSTVVFGFTGSESQVTDSNGILCYEYTMYKGAPSQIHSRFCPYDDVQHKWPGQSSQYDLTSAIFQFFGL